MAGGEGYLKNGFNPGSASIGPPDLLKAASTDFMKANRKPSLTQFGPAVALLVVLLSLANFGCDSGRELISPSDPTRVPATATVPTESDPAPTPAATQVETEPVPGGDPDTVWLGAAGFDRRCPF